MLNIDDASRLALEGSRPADTLTVWAWFDGELAWPEPLQVVSWSIKGSSESSSKVQRSVDLTIADPSGKLSPWRFDDVLGVAGTELELIYMVGGAGAVNVGRFRVESNSPDERFVRYQIDEYGYVVPDSPVAPHKRDVMVTAGSVVVVNAVDLTSNVERDRLLAPESPKGTAPTILSEVGRLVGDHFPVVVHPDVVDRAVAKTLVYERERLEAVQDLLARIGARYRMTGDGDMEVYPQAPGPIRWRVEPMAGLVSVARKQDIGGLKNLWQVTGKEDAKGKPVTATATITTGALRYGGPHGRVPEFYSSEMITTAAQAQAYAVKLKNEQEESLAVVLDVQTVPRPELQAGDRIEVGCPVAGGHVAYLPGEITDISLGGSPIPGPMTMSVSCSYADVLIALGRTEWAQDLGTTVPALTWEQIPSAWGKIPDHAWNRL